MPEGEASLPDALHEVPTASDTQGSETDFLSHLPEIDVRKANNMPPNSVEQPLEQSHSNGSDQLGATDTVQNIIDAMAREVAGTRPESHQTQLEDQVVDPLYGRLHNETAISQRMNKPHKVKRFVSKMMSSIRHIGSKVRHIFRPVPKVG